MATRRLAGGGGAGYVVSVAGDVEVLIGLIGLVEPEHERDRITRQVKKLDKDVDGLDKRLGNPKFADKAPPEVVAEARTLLLSLKAQRERLVTALEFVDELAG
jgi:valyl-tRNA synthetase